MAVSLITKYGDKVSSLSSWPHYQFPMISLVILCLSKPFAPEQFLADETVLATKLDLYMREEEQSLGYFTPSVDRRARDSICISLVQPSTSQCITDIIMSLNK